MVREVGQRTGATGGAALLRGQPGAILASQARHIWV